MTNDVLQTIAERYSCRDYTGEMPSDEQLQAIANAAIASPSAMNRQGWQVLMVCDKALLDELEAEGMRAIAAMEDKSTYERIMSRGGALFYHAPCMVLVPISGESAIMDCGIVAQTVALAAASLGLGSVICGLAGLAFSGDKAAGFKQRLGFAPGYEFGIAVLLGYPKAPGTPHTPDPEKIRFIRG